MLPKLIALVGFSTTFVSVVLIGLATRIGSRLHGDELAFLVVQRGTTAQIFSLDINTGVLFRLMNGAMWSKPAWSPDGRSLAFVSRESSGHGIEVLDVTSGATHRLLDHRLSVDGLSWSPDGSRIAFFTFYSLSVYQLWVVNADGSDLRPLTETTNSFFPAWAPDSIRLVFQSGNGLYVMDTTLKQAQRIPMNVLLAQPDWSPDGRRIAIAGSRPEAHNSRLTSSLYTVDPDTQNIERVTHNQSDCVIAPDWSPDSRQIAFELNCAKPPGIYVIDNDGSHFRLLVGVAAGSFALRPAWRP